MTDRPDCVVIGYNEPPFEDYERLVRTYGEESEAYRDLKFSFATIAGKPLNYVDVMNHVQALVDPVSPRHPLRSGELPNLAAAYLTAFLRRHGHVAEFVNLFQDEKDRLAAYLEAGTPCVAITTTFYVLNRPVVEMVEFIRQHNPSTVIVVGGPLILNHNRASEGDPAPIPIQLGSSVAPRSAPSLFELALRDIGADFYVVDSQGELTLSRLVDHVKRGVDVSDIPNLAYFRAGALHLTPKVAENNPLDDNAIDWSDFRAGDLGPTIQMRTARSCAFSCAFCNYPARAGRLALASLETVERELESALARGDVATVVFIDDTFNVPLERFKELCRLMIRKRYRLNWYSYFRCSNSDDAAVELMAESGCKGVFLGIESGSPTILANMHKAATVEKYRRGIASLRAAGILTFASFIIGFPGETAETVEETRAFIQETRPDYWRAQLWYCERGTPIDGQRAKYEIQGDGFVWRHATMESGEAMNHIERLFLQVDQSIWLPQWSFDFWVIPYLFGRGMTADQFRRFTTVMQRLLALEIAAVPPREKARLHAECLDRLIRGAATWSLSNRSGDAVVAHVS